MSGGHLGVGPKIGPKSKSNRTNGGKIAAVRQNKSTADKRKAQIMAELLREANADPQAFLERVEKCKREGVLLLPKQK